MASLKSIGRNIAKLRLEKGLSQEDLAGMAEIDRSFLSYIENGRNNFSVAVLLKLAEVLEVEPRILLEKDPK